MTIRAFGGPHRYVQGPGAIAELAKLVPLYGRRPFVVLDVAVFDILREQLSVILRGHVDALTFGRFAGECSPGRIEMMAAEAEASGCDLVLAVGGGKAIDTGKGVRILRGGGILVVPTVASNDAPTSRLVVVYTDDHLLKEVRLMPTNPDVVLVDTRVIARAPRRFFVAGIGDALSKKFEVEQCVRSGGSNFYKASPTELALSIADHCYRVVRRDTQAALEAVEAKQPNPAFENIVEATILQSGLGFESGGLSIAHSLTRGFSAIPSLAGALHGEQVAFGLLAQLCLEDRPAAFIAELVAFYRQIGLPTSMRGLGFTGDLTDAVERIASRSIAEAPYIRQFEGEITQHRIIAALTRAEAL